MKIEELEELIRCIMEELIEEKKRGEKAGRNERI